MDGRYSVDLPPASDCKSITEHVRKNHILVVTSHKPAKKAETVAVQFFKAFR